jgi:hypothetical protein
MTVYMPNRAYSLSTATAYPLTKGPMSIAKIVLSPACAPGAREFLQYANISEVTVFPDIQGLVAYRCQFDVTVLASPSPVQKKYVAFVFPFRLAGTLSSMAATSGGIGQYTGSPVFFW